MFIGLSVGVLVVLVDIFLKGFSLRGLSAVTFGIAAGELIAHLVGGSPLLELGDPSIIYLVRLGLFIILPFLCAVVVLRGKDEFNLVIPYVRFVPHEVETPFVVVDTSALIDGRIARVCQTGFLGAVLVIPRFVFRELQGVAHSASHQTGARSPWSRCA